MFIALEGIDGSGKSSQMKILASKLTEVGHKVHTTFEPTDGMVGTIIRKILRGEMKADERTIAGLFVADRLDHLLNSETGILKKLSEGFVVVSDRYYFSSYAYHGTHMNMQWVIDSNAMSASILRPDVTIFLDLDPQNAMDRMKANRATSELYETLENLTNVRNKYFEAFEMLKDLEKIIIVDGNGSMDSIAEEIFHRIPIQ
ncbi:MAG: dTMP kinase [Bacteroidota bacterium]